MRGEGGGVGGSNSYDPYLRHDTVLLCGDWRRAWGQTGGLTDKRHCSTKESRGHYYTTAMIWSSNCMAFFLLCFPHLFLTSLTFLSFSFPFSLLSTSLRFFLTSFLSSFIPCVSHSTFFLFSCMSFFSCLLLSSSFSLTSFFPSLLYSLLLLISSIYLSLDVIITLLSFLLFVFL